MKTERELENINFIKQLGNQKEWEYHLNKKINKLIKKYSSELEDYVFIKDLNSYKNVKLGGYVRYFNLDNKFRWGGILIKKYKSNDLNLMILKNSNNKTNIISFEKNFIFYKTHTTLADKNKKIFLSYLDKY